MTFARLICGAVLFACATAGQAATPQSPPAAAKTLKARSMSSSVRLEYTDFSKLYGSRTVLTADSKLGTGQATRFIVSASAGERTGAATNRAAQASAAIDHDWTERLSSQTAAAAATSGLVFARTTVGQDISYKLGRGLVATAGARYSSYGLGNNVASWSGAAAYYLRGAFVSYRYSLYASNRFGRSHSHLASVRLYDRSGGGYTQLWAGHGTSLYEVELPHSPTGRFTSIAVQRHQPIAGAVGLNVGVNEAWYATPAGRFRGTGVVGGLSFSR